MDVLQILKPRFHRLQLKGFQRGISNGERDRLFAYTILSVRDNEYEDLYNWFLKEESFSFTARDEKRYRNYRDDGSYTMKGADRLVKEDIFQFVSLRFYGALHKNEWFVLNEHSFYEDANFPEVQAEIENLFRAEANVFESPVYQPLPAHDEQLDFSTLTERVSEDLGRPLDFGDYELVFEHAKGWPKEKMPWKKVNQPAERREFIGQPWLVGHLKQERKSKVNRAFENYINETVFLPLVQKLKIQRPEEFAETHGLYSEHYPLIYPHSKEFVLGVVKAIGETGQSRLDYFLYLFSSKQLYQWTKPAGKEVPGHHAEWILEDIRELSVWGNEFSFHEPSVTMDDPLFWRDHVFKQRDGKFLYLVLLQ